jgi:hypothetical protein
MEFRAGQDGCASAEPRRDRIFSASQPHVTDGNATRIDAAARNQDPRIGVDERL